MKCAIAFVHASPAAIPPLMGYYGRAAPELEITNLLDDGILRLFRAGRMDAAIARLDSMIAAARDVHRVRLALATCSAVIPAMVQGMEERAGIPVLKIDRPMAQEAVRLGRRIGVAVSFPPTEPITRGLLEREAAREGRAVALIFQVVPEAYDALLAGDTAKHDRLLAGAVEELASAGCEVIVLAQVSMARTLPVLAGRIPVPVLTSLETSLAAVRRRLNLAS